MNSLTNINNKPQDSTKADQQHQDVLEILNQQSDWNQGQHQQEQQYYQEYLPQQSDPSHSVDQTPLSPSNSNNDDKAFHCPYCGIHIKHRNNVSRHMRTHTGEKPFHCQLCDYSAAQKVQVIKHMHSKHQQQPSQMELGMSSYPQTTSDNNQTHI